MVRSRPQLILASGSPRRRELLEGLGVAFTVRPVPVDESPLPGERPEELVERLARLKARTSTGPSELVLAADTVVVLDDTLLGKPENPGDACAMLRQLSGRQHVVVTGVALLVTDSDELVTGIERTEVRIACLSERQIDWYVSTGEPLDKAGAYAIQGLGALFVEAVYGNYSNVVGLPLPLTQSLFLRLGHDLRHWPGAT